MVRRTYKDIESFYFSKLAIEARKLLSFPLWTRNLIDTVKGYDNVRLVIGFGDMFNTEEMGLGHVHDYKEWRSKIKDIRDKLKKPNEETYNKKINEIDYLFTKKGKVHKDYDFAVVLDDGINTEDRTSFRHDILDTLNKKALKNDYLKTLLRGDEKEGATAVFNGYDFYPQCIWEKNEFIDILKEQIDIAETFSSKDNFNIKRLDKTPKYPKRLVIFTKAGIEIRGEKFDIYPKYENIVIRVEPAKKLDVSEPLYDILKSRGTIIYENNLDIELSGSLSKYQNLKEKPRKLEYQIDIYENYIKDLQSLKINSNLGTYIQVSMEALKDLTARRFKRKSLISPRI